MVYDTKVTDFATVILYHRENGDGMLHPKIELQICTGCGLCANVCTRNGLKVVESVAMFVSADECAGCGLCEMVCPSGAINSPFDVILDEA